MSYYLDRFPRHPRKYCNGSTCNGWTIKNSDIADYLKDFYLDRDGIDLIDATIVKLQSEPVPVIIDLLASEDALFSLYRTLLFDKPKIKALAVGLEHDTGHARKNLVQSFGIDIKEGNLNKRKTWEEMESWLGNDKAHLIIERGYGGLHFVPTNIHYYRAATARLWDMLDPNGGVLLLQTPPFFILEKRGIPINNWLKSLEKENIVHQFSSSYVSQDKGLTYGVLLLQKNPQSRILPDII